MLAKFFFLPYVRNMSDEPDTRLIGYARVSTDDQDLSLQLDALRRYGVPDHAIYREHASGGKMNRVQLERALRPLHPGDTFVVWKLDRLGRTLTGVLEVLAQIEKQGVHFVSLQEKFDTTSHMGKAMLQMSLVFAELERNLIAERTKAGMAVRKAAGVKFGQPPKITSNPKRFAEAQRIVEEGVENISAKEAIARLNAADPKAPKIKSPETWNRWVRLGCPGIDD